MATTTEGSVIRVIVTSQSPDYNNPWMTESTDKCEGSGVCLKLENDEVVVLTAAHVIAHATFVRVQKSGGKKKYEAKVVSVCHQADLALLKIVDETFEPEVAQLSDAEFCGVGLEDEVLLVGFPIGGITRSVTKGIVSRVEVQRCSHSDVAILAITIDAAMNNGNSGGPVFFDDRVVGIAIQGDDDAQNIGEAVSLIYIRRFLEAYQRGVSTDIPIWGALRQNLDNDAVRAYYFVPEDVHGSLITRTKWGHPETGIVQVGDVVTNIAGHTVDDNGNVTINDTSHEFGVVIDMFFIGDTIPLVVWRNGELVELQLVVGDCAPLVADLEFEKPSRYFMVSGLVFQPLSEDLIETYSRHKAPIDFYHASSRMEPNEDLQELVVLTQILEHSCNAEFAPFDETIIESVNDVPIGSLDHMIELIEACDKPFVCFTTSRGYKIVLDRSDIEANTQEIMEIYSISKDRRVA